MELFPKFSPDGERIAFCSRRDGGGIFVMGATGESPRRISAAPAVAKTPSATSAAPSAQAGSALWPT